MKKTDKSLDTFGNEDLIEMKLEALNLEAENKALNKQIEIARWTIKFTTVVIQILVAIAGVITLFGYFKFSELKEIKNNIESYTKENINRFISDSQNKVLSQNIDYYLKNKEYISDNGLRMNNIKNGNPLPAKELEKLLDHVSMLIDNSIKENTIPNEELNEINRIIAIITKQEDIKTINRWLLRLLNRNITPTEKGYVESGNYLNEYAIGMFAYNNLPKTKSLLLKILNVELSFPYRLEFSTRLRDKFKDFEETDFKEKILSKFFELSLTKPQKLANNQNMKEFVDYIESSEVMIKKLKETYIYSIERSKNYKLCSKVKPKDCGRLSNSSIMYKLFKENSF